MSYVLFYVDIPKVIGAIKIHNRSNMFYILERSYVVPPCLYAAYNTLLRLYFDVYTRTR